MATLTFLTKIKVAIYAEKFMRFGVILLMRRMNSVLDGEKKTAILTLFLVLTLSDVNECLDGDLYSCTDEFHKCVNTRGSYKCECEQDLYFIDGKCRGNQPVI